MRLIAGLALGSLLAAEPQAAEARRAEAAGDLASAEKAYEAELQSRPTAETWQRLGLVRHLQNKFEAAIPAFREALRRDPSLWTSHLFLGICLYRTNQFAPALAALEQARRLAPAGNPGSDELDFWLGATRIAARRPLAGLQSLERLLARNPRHAAALELAAQTYADLGSALWNAVAERHFETAAGYEIHGHAMESEGNFQAALEAYRQSKNLDPGRAGPGLGIGRVLLYQGKIDEAFAALKQELTLAPANPETSYYAGLAAVQLGRYPEAAALIEAAAARRPANPEIPVALAQVYLALRQTPKAVQAARRAVELAPFSPAAHEVLIAALAEAGETAALERERQRWQRQIE